MYKKELVEELSTLSQEVFGSRSKWRKLVEYGEILPITEDTKRVDVGTGKTDIVQTAVMHVGKKEGEIPKLALTRHTVDSVREKMLTIKKHRDQLMAILKKNQEEQRLAKEKKDLEAKAAVSSGSGSALS